MTLIEFFLAPIISFGFLTLVFYPMERVFPANTQKLIRKDWAVDIWFFLGQYLIWTIVVNSILFYFQSPINQVTPLFITQFFRELTIWIQIPLIILMSDMMIYWTHRLQHKNAFLWRFHKIHHTVNRLDWLAAHREHPVDALITIFVINFPAFLLGFSLEAISGFIAFRGMWAIYIHSNVRLNIGFLKYFIGSPELHHWHHHTNKNAGNYANLSPLMDLLFGTYTCPDHEPAEFGIDENVKQNYLSLLVEPFNLKK